MKGIYAYVDTMNNSVVYIGKDSNIDKNARKHAHEMPSKYNKQPFNRVLQNNLTRYQYKKVFVFDDITDTELNQLEMQQIALFNPKFNFTKGGDGSTGYKHSEETRKKMKGKNHPFYGKHRSEETRKKISETKTNKFPTINKIGFKDGKQRYSLRHNGKIIKRSTCREKLEIELNKMLKELE